MLNTIFYLFFFFTSFFLTGCLLKNKKDSPQNHEKDIVFKQNKKIKDEKIVYLEEKEIEELEEFLDK